MCSIEECTLIVCRTLYTKDSSVKRLSNDFQLISLTIPIDHIPSRQDSTPTPHENLNLAYITTYTG